MYTRREKVFILAIWVCFAARVTFYSTALPLWEGYDEWSHFGVIRRMATKGEIIVDRDRPVTRDIETSLELAPVPWELRNYPPPTVTREQFWSLSGDEQLRREVLLLRMPEEWSHEDAVEGLRTYEGLQPPLYYWAMQPAMRVLGHMSIPDQVFVLRLLGGFLASLTIVLIWMTGNVLLGDRHLALVAAAVVAVMPEFAIDVARVSNECAAVTLFTLLTWLVAHTIEQGLNVRRSFAIGVVLGLGLLTKAYFLVAIPWLCILFIFVFRLGLIKGRALIRCTLITGLTSFAIAGWWYIRNLLTTQTLSGLNEAVMLRDLRAGDLAHRILDVHWAAAIDSIVFSHLWFGGWSSLTVRSWMYHTFYLLIIVAASGLIRIAVTRKAYVGLNVLSIVLLYCCFWLGQLYNVLILFISKGASTSMGWYMYAVVGAEVLLFIIGVINLPIVRKYRRGYWFISLGLIVFAAFDLYTVHGILLPYYAGLISHQASGSLTHLRPGDFLRLGPAQFWARLGVAKSAMQIRALPVTWIGYLLATVSLPAIDLCSQAGLNAEPSDQIKTVGPVRRLVG